jgi:23S rRNA pseudouridine2605 synthase
MQLNKYLAHAGICSRRDAEKLIREGLITINHAEVSDPGYRVKDNDVVRYKKKVVKLEKKVYVLLNKPTGVVTTTSDDKNRPTVMDCIDSRTIKERLYPVGRLDYDTSGALLLTNDGELAQKLAHPRYKVEKTYIVKLDNYIDPGILDKIRAGIKIDGQTIKVDSLAFMHKKKHDLVKIVIHSGKYRVIRRIFERFGYRVERLDRIKFGPLSVRGLGRGEWRVLTDKEIQKLVS